MLKNWRRVFAALKPSSGRHADPEVFPGRPAGARLSPGTQFETLSGKLDLLEAEQARRDLELATLRERIDAVRWPTRNEYSAVEQRLTVVERQAAALNAGQDALLERITACEVSQAESVQRLETRCNQLKFLQDSEHERFAQLKTALAEVASRLETADHELGRRQDAGEQRLAHIESVQQDTVSRLQALDMAMGELHAAQTHLVEHYEAAHAAISRELDASARLAGALQQRVDQAEHAQRNLSEEIHSRWETRYARIRLALVATALLLLLLAVLQFV